MQTNPLNISRMKKVEAQVRKERFADIDGALKQIGISGLTVAEEERASRGVWCYPLEKIPHVLLTVFVEDSGVGRVVDSICDSASTRSWGDGRIVVSSVDSAWDIGSGMPEQSELTVPVVGL